MKTVTKRRQQHSRRTVPTGPLLFRNVRTVSTAYRSGKPAARYHAGMSGDERERERRRRFWIKRLKWASAILFPPLAYFGTYATIVEPQPGSIAYSALYATEQVGKTGVVQELLGNFYEPANLIDRRFLRRTMWGRVTVFPDGTRVGPFTYLVCHDDPPAPPFLAETRRGAAVRGRSVRRSVSRLRAGADPPDGSWRGEISFPPRLGCALLRSVASLGGVLRSSKRDRSTNPTEYLEAPAMTDQPKRSLWKRRALIALGCTRRQRSRFRRPVASIPRRHGDRIYRNRRHSLCWRSLWRSLGCLAHA